MGKEILLISDPSPELSPVLAYWRTVGVKIGAPEVEKRLLLAARNGTHRAARRVAGDGASSCYASKIV
jgi:hypothetical protein